MTGAALGLLATSCVLGGSSSSAPLPPAPPTVTVTMRDYRFETPGQVPRGRVVFRVENEGTMNHALTLVSLPEDYPPIDEQLRSDVRRGAPTIARVPSWPPGHGSTFAVDLAPGRYAMVCFVTDPDGVIHGRKGMSAEVRVLD